jgi:hypothetical protein
MSSAPLATAARSASTIALCTLAWALVAGFAIASFSQQATWNRYDIVQGEVASFAYAFAVAGSIAGVTATAAAGRRRLAIGLGAVDIGIIAASVFIIRVLIFRIAGPSVSWSTREWVAMVGYVRISSAVGAGFGLFVSGLVLAVSVVERRSDPWKFGLAVAAVAAVLGLWAFPLVSDRATSLAIPHLRWNYGHRHDETLRGALSGAGTGALAGAIVVGLLARWSGLAPGNPGADANNPRSARV